MNIPKNYIDSTWFVIDRTNVSFANYRIPQGIKLACASLLKPLYVWSASGLVPFNNQKLEWSNLSRLAITISSNDSMTKIWEEAGGCAILSTLKYLTSVNFMDSPPKSWGSIRVNADMIARGYGALLLATAHDAKAAQVVALMKQVNSKQAFGLDAVIKKRCPQQVESIGIKCGWYVDEVFCRLRTHAVIFAGIGDGRTLGFVILTSSLVDDSVIKSYMKAYVDGEEVLDIHEDISGNILRSELSRLIELASI